jgi:hypothetical protein
MKSTPDTYCAARALLDRYGSLSGEPAYQMMRCCLETGDQWAAGIWLAIGNAIEDLQTLTLSGTLH